MARVLSANPATVSAVRKAHRLPNDLRAPGKQRLSPSQSSIPSRGGESYYGPFSIVQKNDTTVTVKAKDGADYFADNLIVMGLETGNVASDTDITISVSGSIYIKVTYYGGVQYAFGNASSLPNQVNGQVYIELYSVEFADGAIQSLNRSRGGHIHIAGRIVGV